MCTRTSFLFCIIWTFGILMALGVITTVVFFFVDFPMGGLPAEDSTTSNSTYTPTTNNTTETPAHDFGNASTYNDLLVLAHNVLQKHPALAKKWLSRNDLAVLTDSISKVEYVTTATEIDNVPT